MLLVLLLICRASCDWVEITQNHFKKEPAHYTIQTTDKKHEQKPQDNRFYRNNTVTENHWNKGSIDRVSNVGNIRRVIDPTVKTPSIKLRPSNNEYTRDRGDINLNKEHRFNSEHLETIHNPFEEVSLKGNNNANRDTITSNLEEPLKRIQTVSNSNVKSGFKLSQNPVNHKNVKIYEDESYPTSNSDQNPVNFRKVEVYDDNIYSNTNSDENKISKEQDISKGLGIPRATNRVTHTDDLNVGVYSSGNYQRLPTTVQILPTRNANVKSNLMTTPTPKIRIGTIFDKENSQKVESSDVENSKQNDFKFFNASATTKPKLRINDLDKMDFEENNDKISKSNLPKVTNLKDYPSSDMNSDIPEKPTIEETKDEKEDGVNKFEDLSNVTKVESMNAMWKLMKIVTDTIYKNTHRSFKSKIKYLEGLKETILTSIEQHIDSVWPDDMGWSRRARSAHARGHVEFPSSESTLMTISFLTFAVFLIKLVLQVIHTYKNKTMMVAPAVVAAVGRAAATLRSQKNNL